MPFVPAFCRPLSLFVVWLLVGLGAVEVGVRLSGATHHASPAPSFEVTPAAWVEPDARLGWRLRPGEFTFAFGQGHTARARHDSMGQRVTPQGRGRVLELHGGSFAYGLGLEDAESMGWRLQERLPDHDVRTRAAPGHGPLQAWQALQEHIERGTRPYALVVTYVSFHDERVTWNRSWRRALSGNALAEGLGPAAMPSVRTKHGPPQVRGIDPGFEALPGARFSAALAELDRRRDAPDERELESTEVTRNLLVALHHRAKEHGIHVLVVGLSSDDATHATLEQLGTQGVLTLDAGLDWTDRRNQLWPHDHHPNGAAADHWARSVADLVSGGASDPGGS